LSRHILLYLHKVKEWDIKPRKTPPKWGLS
jgi:hypothetical protein